MSIFHFKKFSVRQKKSAMKVGTDSILLGSWVAVNSNVKSILDIGTGTGILALMLAQRSNAINIDAIEIESDAYEEAVTNFENSPWANHLFCYHATLQDFTEEIDDKYDLIIANPPFFGLASIENISKRNIARQTQMLDHVTLLKMTKLLLSTTGSCALVIPIEIEHSFIKSANNIGLFAFRILHTKDTVSAPIKRSFLQLKHKQRSCETSELVLKKRDKTYSEAFVTLTKDFYRDF